MPVYQNKALQDQMMRVATQGQQRSINDKARQAAVAKAIGATGQVAAQAYSVNAAEVMKQAKELGLSSPEEIAGLKKVMEISERTGLTVEEITGSPKLMGDLMREAKGRRVKQDSLDESIGELRHMRKVKGKELGSLEEQYGAAEQATADARKRAKDIGSLEGTLGGPLPLGIDSSSEADTKYLNEKADRNSISSEMHRMKIEDLDIQDKIKSREAERKANVMSPDRLAKLKALQNMGLTTDQLNAARRSVASGQKLDKLASSNLVGRDMVGRMAAEGSRAGMKELTAQKAAAAQLALKNRELDQSASKSAGKVRSDAIKDMTSFATKNIIYSNLSQMRMRNLADFTAIKDVGVGAGLSHNDAAVLAESMIKGRQESSIINFEKALSAQEYKSAMLGLQRERIDQGAEQYKGRLEQSAAQHKENLEEKKAAQNRKPSKNPFKSVSQKGKNAAKAAEAEEKKAENTKKSRIKTLENTVVSLSGVLAGSIPHSAKSAKPLAKAQILLSKIQGGDEQLKAKIVRKTGRSWQQVEKELEEYISLTTTTGAAPVSTVTPEVKQEALKKVRRATGGSSKNSDPLIQELEAKEAAGKK